MMAAMRTLSRQDARRVAVRRLKSGPLGGDQQIGAMVAEDRLDAVIFLRDPLTAQPHEPAPVHAVPAMPIDQLEIE